MKNVIFILSSILLTSSFYCFGQNEKVNYKVVSRFQLEGDGGWDYLTLDENTGRLFISHSTVTQVIDKMSGKLIGTINDTKGLHGIALDQEDNKAFISCGKDSSVVVVNLATLEFIDKIKVTGANPDAILYDKFSNKVFAYNGRSANATIIDPKTLTVVATIPLAGKPEFSVSDGAGKVYVNIEDKSLLTVIDSKKLKVIEYWPLSPGQEPSGLALDNENHRLFSVCDNNKMVVMDARNGQIIATVEIGSSVDGCAFDAVLKRAYSSNGEGTVTVVQEESADNYSVLETVPTQKGPAQLSLTRKHITYICQQLNMGLHLKQLPKTHIHGQPLNRELLPLLK